MTSRVDVERVLRSDGADTIIDVWVVPGASRSEIVGVHNEALRVRLAAPPEGGKANQAMLVLLGEILDVHPQLDRGSTSRRKQVRIENLPPSAVAAFLLEHLSARR